MEGSSLCLSTQSSVESSYKVRSSWRWFGPRSVDCKGHFHVTVMKRTLVKPLFKVWGIWDKWKIKMQTSLSCFGILKAVFLVIQSTLELSVNIHLVQVHSSWTGCHWSYFMVHFREACLHCLQQAVLKQLYCSQEGRQAHFLGKNTLEMQDHWSDHGGWSRSPYKSQGNSRQCSKTWS